MNDNFVDDVRKKRLTISKKEEQKKNLESLKQGFSESSFLVSSAIEKQSRDIGSLNLAKTEDIEKVVKSLNQLKQIPDKQTQKISQEFVSLSQGIDKLIDAVTKQKTVDNKDKDLTQALTNLSSVLQGFSNTRPNNDEKLTELINVVNQKEFKTEIKTTPIKVQTQKVDLAPVIAAVQSLSKQMGSFNIAPEIDITEVSKGLVSVEKAVRDLIKKPIPVPETPLPFSDGSKGVQVVLDNNRLPVSTSPLSGYLIADEEETATYSYIGYENKDGGWCIQRETLASGAYRYAVGTSNYTTAWTDRATQTYQYPSQAF